MLLKWLFTLLVIIWLYQALGPYLGVGQKTNIRQKSSPQDRGENNDDDDGEYIDYEEIK